MSQVMLSQRDAHAGRWLHVVVLVALLAVVAGLGAHGVALGLGHDLDSRAILENSVAAILRGSYVTGRSYGDPLYEYAAAGLYAVGGVVLANCYSVVLALACVLVFDRLLARTDLGHRAAALIGMTLGPVFLTNSSCFGEWMQTFFCVIFLLWCAQKWLADPRAAYLGLYGLASALLVLTRPDALFVCICVFCAMIWQLRFARARSLQLVAASALAGALTVAVFVLINGGTGFLNNLAFDHNDTWLRALIIAGLGIFTVFGPVGLAVLAGCTIWLLRRLWREGDRDLTLWSRVYLIGIVVAFPRYVVFPQKLEYIFYLVIFSLLMVANERVRVVWAGLLAASVILPSLVTISLFERHGANDHLFVRFGLGPSAILQDWTTTKADWDVMDPDFLRRVAERVYAGEPGPPPRLYTVNFGPGLQSDSGDLVIGETEAYRLDNPRSGPMYQRVLYQRIFICDQSVFHGGAGWRFLEQPVARLALDPVTGTSDVKCHRETAAGVAGNSD
jgi:hypothetical protein